MSQSNLNNTDSEYVCINCNKSYSNKYNLKKHQENTCKGINQHNSKEKKHNNTSLNSTSTECKVTECKYCSKQIKYRNISRHQSICNKNISDVPNTTNLKQLGDLVNRQLQERCILLQDRCALLQLQIDEKNNQLKEKNEQITELIQKVGINNNTIININNNITLMCDANHLTNSDEYMECINKLNQQSLLSIADKIDLFE